MDSEHERIWLEPICQDAAAEGRLWCAAKLDDCDDPDCGAKAVEFIRADLVPDPTPLVEALKWYADQMCEGFCAGKDPKACKAIGSDNCCGCPAVVAIAEWENVHD